MVVAASNPEAHKTRADAQASHVGAIRNTLFLAGAVRSGSTYVAEEIAYRLQRDAGFQFFNLTRDFFATLTANSTAADVQRIYSGLFLDGSGWASSKIHCAALSIITREARRDATLHKAFFGPKARWIIVRRRDKIAQAASLAVARATGAWHVYSKPEHAAVPEIGIAEVEAALRSILLDDVYLEAFCHNIIPRHMIRVDYEDLVAGGRAVTAAAIDLCGLHVTLRRERDPQVAKILRTTKSLKSGLAQKFAMWLGENYHDTAAPHAAGPKRAAPPAGKAGAQKIRAPGSHE